MIFKQKEYNKLADTDYKMEEYVRLPKEEYEELKNNINLIAKKHDKLLLNNIELQDKLDKIKEYIECEVRDKATGELWSTDIEHILSIIESESE